MQATIQPGNISGTIAAPPSKSMTQRAYAAALLHRGETIIHHAGHSDDERAALQIIQQLGAKLISQASATHIPGAGHLTVIHSVSDHVYAETGGINCGESGLAARLFTPIAALSEQAITIAGSGSLLHRPMQGFDKVLPQLGITLTGFNGHLPFSIQGPMQAADMSIDASAGSQFLSGLLFALTSAATQPVSITVTDLASKPYIDMTLQMLAHFGKPVTHADHKTFYIDTAKFTYHESIDISIEADWSGAACLLVAGAIAGEITIQNLNIDSAQADRAMLDVLRAAGAGIKINGRDITICKAPLRPFEFDATHCPDLFPALAILAACCEGESYITGVHRLFHKESNRAESITEMLQDFAVPHSIEDDALCITGVRRLQGTVVNGYNDHRIVMAAAVGALCANGPVEISDATAVNKSYPAFFNDLILCGVDCKTL